MLRYTGYGVIFFLLLQVGIAGFYSDYSPERTEVSSPPKDIAFAGVSYLGDTNAMFYTDALRFQNIGDEFGNSTPLREYDYDNIVAWLRYFDMIESRSNFQPSIAAYYFAVTPDKSQKRAIVAYLNEHYSIAPDDKWWWLLQAILIAKYKIKDYKWSYSMSKTLIDRHMQFLPPWAKNMPLLLLLEMGETEQIASIVAQMQEHLDAVDDRKSELLRDFILQRAKTIMNAKRASQ